MKRFVLGTWIAVSILAGCASSAPSTGSSQGAGSSTPPVSGPPPVSAAPSAPPSGSARYPGWFTGEQQGAGILPAGSHTTRKFTPGFTFTVPNGWVNGTDQLDVYALFPDTPANAAEHAATDGLAHELSIFRFGSPYWICGAWEDHRGATAAEIVASLMSTEAIATSEPIDVEIGGLAGKQIDIRLDPGWTETCPGDPPTFDLGDTRTRVLLLDTPDRGPVFINVGSLHSADHEAFLAEAMPIVESFRFDVTQ